MIFKQANGIHWLEFELLSNFPEIQHAVYLRHGGLSTASYGSLNLGKHMGDTQQNYRGNLAKVKELFCWSHLAESQQPHGKLVCEATIENCSNIPPCDGLLTANPEIALKITHADCQAAIFYDPMHRVIANVHCGWRGNVQNIYAETIHSMRMKYNSKPADIFVCVSPSLGPNKSEFINYRTELPEEFWQFQHKPNYFDLWALTEWQLNNAGILAHHVQLAKICTYENETDCFSYRRSKPTGCHGTLVKLR